MRPSLRISRFLFGLFIASNRSFTIELNIFLLLANIDQINFDIRKNSRNIFIVLLVLIKMASRKKQLYKIIILGDSGYIPLRFFQIDLFLLVLGKHLC